MWTVMDRLLVSNRPDSVHSVRDAVQAASQTTGALQQVTSPPQTLTTGLPALDRTLGGLLPGDNFVWEVDNIGDYAPFALPLLDAAQKTGRKLIYFRFAPHKQLLPPGPNVEVCTLDPSIGFEKFLARILEVIKQNGASALYLFDWISDLATAWYSDRMLANFFMIVCPYILQFDTLGYFGLRRNYHSWHAVEGIHDSAQVILEVYRKPDRLYIHPIKVFNRHSPTMYALHAWENGNFRPVTSSTILSEILAQDVSPWIDFTMHRFGEWTRTFMEAQETLQAIEQGEDRHDEADAFRKRLIRMAVTRNDKFIRLAKEYFTLSDLVSIMKRMIGTGLIGGKSLGMLLARAILRTVAPRWSERLEVHDSFLIGSDVFYTYLVRNHAWRVKIPGEELESIIARAEDARRKVLRGTFPTYIADQFEEMLAYFGQSPIIVRSSSLLEDSFGSAFAGKYESVFCANQGPPGDRLEAFMEAVRRVYASTMSREAIMYRIHRGLYDQDEQMGLLVQRVSGEMREDRYFPQIAGVGYSFNPYAWSRQIDPQAGVLRMVFGLGTRAVDRTADDYTRLVALNAPQRRPERDFGRVREVSQKQADLLDLRHNRLETVPWREAAASLPKQILHRIATCDEEVLRSNAGVDRHDLKLYTLTFDGLFRDTPFVADMQEILKSLERAYGHPVDIEFTANMLDDGRYRINLLQCRPFHATIEGTDTEVRIPADISAEELLIESHGPIIGQSREIELRRIVYVKPSEYQKLSLNERYVAARLIGQVVHHEENAGQSMLLGPGRWGTSMPELGLPVTFPEISPASALCELAVMHEGLIPDVSLGTHFLSDLVELDILCLSVFPGQEKHRFNDDYFDNAPNALPRMLPDAAKWAEVVRVIEPPEDSGRVIRLHADSIAQKAMCFLADA